MNRKRKSTIQSSVEALIECKNKMKEMHDNMNHTAIINYFKSDECTSLISRMEGLNICFRCHLSMTFMMCENCDEYVCNDCSHKNICYDCRNEIFINCPMQKHSLSEEIECRKCHVKVCFECSGEGFKKCNLCSSDALLCETCYNKEQLTNIEIECSYCTIRICEKCTDDHLFKCIACGTKNLCDLCYEDHKSCLPCDLSFDK